MDSRGKRLMGRGHSKILGLITAFLLFSTACLLFAGSDETSVILKKFKLPEYNKDSNDLEFIVYGREAETIGVMINLDDLKIEWYAKGNDKSPRATVTTPAGVFDRSTKIIRGDKDVHFRSSTMDVDGIGFDADQAKQTIHIRSNVKVRLKESLQTEKEKTKTRREEPAGKAK